VIPPKLQPGAGRFGDTAEVQVFIDGRPTPTAPALPTVSIQQIPAPLSARGAGGIAGPGAPVRTAGELSLNPGLTAVLVFFVPG